MGLLLGHHAHGLGRRRRRRQGPDDAFRDHPRPGARGDRPRAGRGPAGRRGAGRRPRPRATVIEAGGHGAAFFHRLGHGIGLEVHEDPYVVEGNTEPLASGDAFSVEPGIYLEGRYGVRIEDIVVCAPEGADVLNDAPRELLVVSGT